MIVPRKHIYQSDSLYYAYSTMGITKAFAEWHQRNCLQTKPKNDISKAVEGALSGKAFYSSDVYETVMDIMKKPADYFTKFDELDLSKREKQVLQLFSKEFTTEEIAEKLFLSPNTAETHRINLFLKFGVKNVAGLIKKAMERQLLE